MRLKYIVLILSCVLLLVGCAPQTTPYEVRTMPVASDVTTLKVKYKQVERSAKQQQYKFHIFSKNEWQDLLKLDATIYVIISKYEVMALSNTQEINVDDVRFLWQMAGEGYTLGREVVYKHWDIYSESSKVLLKSFDRRAILISDQMNIILNNPSKEGLQEAMSLIIGALQEVVNLLEVAIS